MLFDSRQQLYLLQSPVLVIDRGGVVQLANDEALALLGAPRALVEGHPVSEQPWRPLSLDGRVLIGPNRPHELIFAGAPIEHTRLLIERASGERRVVECSGARVDDVLAMFALNDISELYAAREALLAQERHLLEAQSIARVGSWRFDLLTRELSWSPQVFHLLGLDPAGPSPSFEDFLSWIPDDERARWLDTVQPTFEDGRPYEIAHRLILPDGAVRHVLSRGEGRRDEQGHLVGFSGTAQDVTAQHLSAQQQHALLRELHEAERLRSLGLLAGGIAHDFNNLLAGVIGNAALLTEDLSGEPRAAGALSDITKAAQQMIELTSNLLAYAGKSTPQRQVVNLFDALNETHHVTRLALNFSCSLHLIRPEIPFCVEVDPGHLRQILLNVVVNAADAVRERRDGLIKITMTYHPTHEALASRGHGFVCLTIQDNGEGMDAQTLGQIFEPFFTTKHGGRGLGLSAVQGFIRSMGGAVQVRSTPGEGTHFHIFLPLVTAVAPEPAQLGEVSEARSMAVLVVDDEALVRNICQRTLEREGLTVYTASGGEEARRWLAARAEDELPELIILDMMMPGMHGVEVFELLRQEYSGVKFILMSGFTEESLVELEQLRGDIVFLQKPFYPNELKRLIKRLMM